jgi:hypothetical protein
VLAGLFHGQGRRSHSDVDILTLDRAEVIILVPVWVVFIIGECHHFVQFCEREEDEYRYLFSG